MQEPAPDRVTDLAKQLRIPLDIVKQAYDVFSEICNALDHPMASVGRRWGFLGPTRRRE